MGNFFFSSPISGVKWAPTYNLFFLGPIFWNLPETSIQDAWLEDRSGQRKDSAMVWTIPNRWFNRCLWCWLYKVVGNFVLTSWNQTWETRPDVSLGSRVRRYIQVLLWKHPQDFLEVAAWFIFQNCELVPFPLLRDFQAKISTTNFKPCKFS